MSWAISVYTPQRAPLLTMLPSRRAASSLKLAGKSATTRKRYGSASSPACALYSSIDLELVAEVLLDDVLHVLGQVGQPLLDVRAVGPDARADQGLVVVGQVHEAGEVLAQPDRVDDREAHPPGRQRGQQPGHDRLQERDGLPRAPADRSDQQRAAMRKGQHGRHAKIARVVGREVAQLQDVSRPGASSRSRVCPKRTTGLKRFVGRHCCQAGSFQSSSTRGSRAAVRSRKA